MSELADPRELSPDEARKAVQELRVHHIELEIQNEELRRTQDELSAARERYFDLYDLAPVGYLTLGDTGKVLEANLTGARLLGEKRLALVGQSFTRFVSPADQDIWYHARRRLVESVAPQSVELEMRRADGVSFHAHLDINHYRDPAGRTTIRTVVTDVSELKRLEAEQLQLERRLMQAEKSESLGRLASGIAHHFNDLLGAVTGNVETILANLPPKSEPARALQDALSAAHQAGSMSKSLLTYLGQNEGLQVHRDVTDLCRRALPGLRAAMPPHVHLEEDLPSPGPTVAAIPGQIELILKNLVTNACEAVDDTEEEGIVRLAIRTVSRKDLPARDRFPVDWIPRHEAYCCLAVTDPGEGVGPWLVDHVFDPFFSTKAFGRGLGLPVALGVARAHGGAIAVMGGLGVESTMEVYLPVSPKASPEPWQTVRVVPDTDPSAGAVLVVDDEALMRRMTSRVLAQLGYEVLLAEGGIEAIALFNKNRDRIRWVLCDLTMKGMNGWQTMAAMRSISAGVRVVLTSGFDEAHMMSGRGSVDPPFGFLRKPWTLQELEAVAPRR